MTELEVPLPPSVLAVIDDLVQQRVRERVAALQTRPIEPSAAQNLAENGKADRFAMIIFSGDLDKLIAAFTFATAAASMGLSVSMFFSFWGLVALKQRADFKGKSLVGKIVTAMLPSAPGRAPTSQMNCFGLGPRLIK